MRVKEVMIREVTTLSVNMSVKEAAKKIFDMEISGLPVVDEAGRLVGMFTEKGILKAILPSYVEKVGKFIYEEDPKTIRKKVEALNSLKVKDLMRTEVVTVGEETSLYETARLMLTQRARRVPVIDKENKIVGIVARCDIVKALTREA